MTENSTHGIATQMRDRTLLVHLDRPEILNAYDDRMLLQLGITFREAASDPAVKAVVLTGRGRGFCSGPNMKAERMPGAVEMGLRHRMTPVVLAMTSIEKPVIAAINGAVAGAALGFIGAADMRIAADSAVFVPATAKLGLTPDAGASYFLPRILGAGRAFRWIAGGEKINAETALDWGLVDEVVDGDAMLDRALEHATVLSSGRGAAAALTKRLIASSCDASLTEQLELEHLANDEARRTLALESEG